jgi:hypothetical protein
MKWKNNGFMLLQARTEERENERGQRHESTAEQPGPSYPTDFRSLKKQLRSIETLLVD